MVTVLRIGPVGASRCSSTAACAVPAVAALPPDTRKVTEFMFSRLTTRLTATQSPGSRLVRFRSPPSGSVLAAVQVPAGVGGVRRVGLDHPGAARLATLAVPVVVVPEGEGEGDPAAVDRA